MARIATWIAVEEYEEDLTLDIAGDAEAHNELNELARDGEDIEQDAEQLADMTDLIKESDEVNETVEKVVTLAVESYCTKWCLGKFSVGIESRNGWERKQNLLIALEAADKSIWQRIKDFISAMIKRIKDFFNRMFGRGEKLEKQAAAIKKAAPKRTDLDGSSVTVLSLPAPKEVAFKEEAKAKAPVSPKASTAVGPVDGAVVTIKEALITINNTPSVFMSAYKIVDLMTDLTSSAIKYFDTPKGNRDLVNKNFKEIVSTLKTIDGIFAFSISNKARQQLVSNCESLIRARKADYDECAYAIIGRHGVVLSKSVGKEENALGYFKMELVPGEYLAKTLSGERNQANVEKAADLLLTVGKLYTTSSERFMKSVDTMGNHVETFAKREESIGVNGSGSTAEAIHSYRSVEKAIVAIANSVSTLHRVTMELLDDCRKDLNGIVSM